ncbi:MAG: hypothetical protein CMJ83_09220 [Planctomycetes bacterium]|nr:hypothetical protein [Planctomycetota bacterium]
MSHGLEPGRLLVAAKSLYDDNFHRTVILLCRCHPEMGALGLVLNRPTEIPVGRVLPEEAAGRKEPLWIGGPVDGRSLWIVHRRGDLDDPGEEVIEGVWFGAASSLIEGVLATNAPDAEGTTFRLYVGYAGWGEGQLEQEMEADAWKVVPTGMATLFTGATSSLWDDMMLRSLLPCSREPELLTNSWLS